ncbi:MAG: hypothetical protein R3D00_02070 [Bacteroidia bacterium]
MNHAEKISRINYICGNFELDFEILVNKKNKILLGGSFDFMYYYQFFILLTGVEKNEFSQSLEPEGATYRFISFTDNGTDEASGLRKTAFHYMNPYFPDNIILHKGLYYYAPAEPLFTLLGAGNEAARQDRLMDITKVIDKCFALEDELQEGEI